ncbi:MULTISPECIES: MOSC domain-containing protein [unclassified Halanaerobium]|uniref:MOSC domain-containing protein n=1 Tax=unclassified Halanaerobium TaxID=2641197 RepID=UPI000DF26411|nr:MULTISPECIES: MOSC domain-containing protein [unclassified Halanaerobium]RCW49684.1 MOSC domain-containing protein [Halanaerobium sp. MA284_MarDTE_T2]RCW88369.1 MOSC domain-containing protein [Halanaerobium sp. DL-01]
MNAKIKAVCRSKEKGTTKNEINKGELIEDFGLKGDAHAGNWHRQISLLDSSSIDKMKNRGWEIRPGDFAENITTEGMENLYKLSVGQKIRIRKEILLEITQIGKKCHQDCEIRQKIGDCVMPREGVFAKVIKGGEIKPGDKIEILEN